MLTRKRKNSIKTDRVDINPLTSPHGGLLGLFETALRRFKILVHIATVLPLYFLASICIAVAFLPGVLLFHALNSLTADMPALAKYFATALALSTGYFLYGFTIIFVAPFINSILGCRLKEWRGPYYSVACMRWYIHNGLTYLVRYTFLEFITPTPFNLMFYRMMGMKIGARVQINSSCISDPSLIELGDQVTIGGSATLVAHYGAGGFLVIAPVKIGAGATIGLRATIMGGVQIGENSKILPNSVVLPKTIVPANETWGGVPAQKIDFSKAA